jgi:hypothetical protein
VELVALQKVLPDIVALGASLVAISPQLPEHNRELSRSRALGFPILTDRGNEVATRFGLTFTLPDYLRALYGTFPLDLAKYNGDASWTLPMPRALCHRSRRRDSLRRERSRLHDPSRARGHAGGAARAAWCLRRPATAGESII